ncbi:MAG: DUF262 domain-containing protein [Acidobacteria bacterium]|nr:DUF262 domain-containing protein [Acidobacteriota bacterium]
MSNENHLTEPIASEDADSESPLRTYEILTYPADFTLELLVTKWKDKEITLAEGQRKYIWPQAKASKLIESFLMGLPVPPIYLYQDPEDNRLKVVDGQQRLMSVVFFFSGFFGERTDVHKPNYFTLVGLDEKSPYLNKTYQELKAKDQLAYNKLTNSVLRSFVMKQIRPDDNSSIFEVFERLNTGGMILQPQEIRNCIYTGKFNEFLKGLNRYENWRHIIGKKGEDQRMRDIELILRFFAALHNIKKYEKPMKEFLNKYMFANRRFPDSRKKKFEKEFKETADAVVQYLGKKPFHLRRGLNVAVYDSVFTAFARQLHNLTHKANQIAQTQAKFETLKQDDEYIGWITSATTDKDVVPKRIDRAEEVLFGP